MTLAQTVLDQIVARTVDPPTHVKTLRLPYLDGWEPGRVWGRWDVDEAYFHAMGAVFGGYIAALADHFVSLAIWSTMSDDETFTTADLRLSFFRPITTGTVEIAAEVLHRGRRMAHVEAVFLDHQDKVAVKATATKVIMPLRDTEPSGSGA